ncbi:MAG: hypothetical protein AAF648_03435 [Pseudomonadota bacterium]
MSRIITEALFASIIFVRAAAGFDVDCPPGFEHQARAGGILCMTPPSLTYRRLEPCQPAPARLVPDFVGFEDRCVLDAENAVWRPACSPAFTLETKPGHDRCWRLDPPKTAPVVPVE